MSLFGWIARAWKRRKDRRCAAGLHNWKYGKEYRVAFVRYIPMQCKHCKVKDRFEVSGE